jgi:hypothetical protein
MRRIERCGKQIAQAEAKPRAGYCDMDGLLLQLMDWATERRLLSATRLEITWA